MLRRLQVLDEIGLGYLRLGQPATTLSGGEAQRIKIAAHLSTQTGERVLYILDEPTTGLHFDDIAKLLAAFRKLLQAGHSLLVIEHNLDVIKTADWVIDLGPEGGEEGGQVVAVGTPETIAQIEASHTGRYLREVLDGPPGRREVATPSRSRGRYSPVSLSRGRRYTSSDAIPSDDRPPRGCSRSACRPRHDAAAPPQRSFDDVVAQPAESGSEGAARAPCDLLRDAQYPEAIAQISRWSLDPVDDIQLETITRVELRSTSRRPP